jgi:SAM-dependent methyltransferase
MYGRELIVATDVELPYLHMLRNRFSRHPNIHVEKFDLNSDDYLQLRQYGFDTVVCLNVLEHVEDHIGALQRLYDVLVPGGKLLLWVPADQALFGTMDEQVGHVRRYEREELRALIQDAGFTMDSIRYQNRFGRLPWWLNGRVLKRRDIPGGQSRLFEWIVPILRWIESPEPKKGLSLVAIATKAGERAEAQRLIGS